MNPIKGIAMDEPRIYGKVLSKELIVAVEIYRLTIIEKQEVYFQKLVENLKGKSRASSPVTISKALDILLDLGMADAEWKQLPNGRWARSLKISGESKNFIKAVYRKTCKPG